VLELLLGPEVEAAIHERAVGSKRMDIIDGKK